MPLPPTTPPDDADAEALRPAGAAPAEPADATDEAARPPDAVLSDLLAEGQVEAATAYARDLHPAELAEAISGIDADIRRLALRELAATEIGAALPYLDPHYRQALLTGMDPAVLVAVLREAPDDIATDAVQDLPERLQRRVLSALPEHVADRIHRLLVHDEHTAGGRMTGYRLAIPVDATVREAIRYLRQIAPTPHRPFYLYTVERDGRLRGVVNLRSLLTTPPDRPVHDVADTDITAVSADTDQEEAARLLKRYRLLAMPVVDDEGRLLGAVTADDLLDVLEEEATEDMFRIVGVDEAEDLRSIWRSVRFRLPWLTVNLATVLLAAWVISVFEGTLTRVAVLAAFLPVVAGSGGNAGMQTLTVVVRSLALGRLSQRHALQVVLRELAAGAVMGLAIGALIFAVSAVWQGDPLLGLVVAVALFLNTLVGVAAGTLIPLGLQRLQQDPALSGSIWLTTATDVIGFVLLLGIAATLVSQLE